MKARTRYKGDPTPQGEGVLYVSQSGGPAMPYPCRYPLMPPSKREVMHDVVGNKQSYYNPVDHFSVNAPRLTGVSYLVSGNEIDGFTQYSMSNGVLTTNYLPHALNSYPFLDAQFLDDFSVDAEFSFKTAVPDTQSIINFCIEMVELLEGNIRGLQHIVDLLKRAVETFRKVLESTGSYWVAWNFAIKPFLSDVNAFKNTVLAAAKRLRWLRKHNHNTVRVRYRRAPMEVSVPLIEVENPWCTPVTPQAPFPPLPPNCLGFFAKGEATVQINAYGYVKFDIPDYILDDTLLAMGMILSAMNGLYNPLKIVWEAIPFSWLIDWLIDKRTQMLKELASLSPFPDATIIGTGYTLNIKMFGQLYHISDYPGEEIFCGDFLYKRFLRRPGLPTGDSSIWSTGLDLRQWSILGGIGGQGRIAPRRR